MIYLILLIYIIVYILYYYWCRWLLKKVVNEWEWDDIRYLSLFMIIWPISILIITAYCILELSKNKNTKPPKWL
jgi:K+-transporting ATPase A subunit